MKRPVRQRLTLERLRSAVRRGRDVVDSVGNSVGYVEDTDPVTGWMTIYPDSFDLERLYVPYRLVTKADGDALTMAIGVTELRTYYRDRPARATNVSRDGKKTVATTTQRSGYDDSVLTVALIDVDQMQRLIVPGYKVWTYDQVELGLLMSYDETTGYMEIEKGSVSRRETLVPLSLVSGVDGPSATIQLVSSTADLQRLRLGDPVRVVLLSSQGEEA